MAAHIFKKLVCPLDYNNYHLLLTVWSQLGHRLTTISKMSSNKKNLEKARSKIFLSKTAAETKSCIRMLWLTASAWEQNWNRDFSLSELFATYYWIIAISVRDNVRYMAASNDGGEGNESAVIIVTCVRERRKSNRYILARQQLCTRITLFVHFQNWGV